MPSRDSRSGDVSIGGKAITVSQPRATGASISTADRTSCRIGVGAVSWRTAPVGSANIANVAGRSALDLRAIVRPSTAPMNEIGSAKGSSSALARTSARLRRTRSISYTPMWSPSYGTPPTAKFRNDNPLRRPPECERNIVEVDPLGASGVTVLWVLSFLRQLPVLAGDGQRGGLLERAASERPILETTALVGRQLRRVGSVEYPSRCPPSRVATCTAVCIACCVTRSGRRSCRTARACRRY
jgi:hypothetical protein